jgi:hypothetical protein
MNNNELPFDLMSLGADDVQSLEDTYKALRAKFNISLSDDAGIHLKQFELFNTDPGKTIGGTLLVNTPANNLHLAFIKIHYSHYNVNRTTTTDYYRYQVWAFINTKADFGRVLIRHETFNDRIVGLLHPCELDCPDDKPFNHKFYVVTNDEQKALSAMNWNFRNAVMNMGDDMMMETEGHTIIIGNNVPVEAEQTVRLVEFAAKVAAVV